MKHVILYSGGHSSAICAIEVARKFGSENVILLNHDISPIVESFDIKRFKMHVAKYLGLRITYANHPQWEVITPIKVCIKEQAWKVDSGPVICTSKLKTKPFENWLRTNDPDGDNIYYYGFDITEQHRIQRRSSIMGSMGYKTDYPVALWKDRTIFSTTEIDIPPPNGYQKFKHANCIGCLKAGWQHWYIVYCERQDLFLEGMNAEDEIGYSIHKEYLYEKVLLFEEMKKAGVKPTEHISPSAFWSNAKKRVKEKQLSDVIEQLASEEMAIPCECTF